MASLWGGRFEKDMDEIVKKYNASIFFDQRMYNEDIDGSIAHVTMLGKQGIVSNEEKDQIIAGLEEIRKEIVEGKILFTVEDEDIHMGIESRPGFLRYHCRTSDCHKHRKPLSRYRSRRRQFRDGYYKK